MVNEALERNRRETQQVTATLMDQSDRSAFEARCASNPLFRKLQSEVERELQGLRQRGEPGATQQIAPSFFMHQSIDSRHSSDWS